MGRNRLRTDFYEVSDANNNFICTLDAHTDLESNIPGSLLFQKGTISGLDPGILEHDLLQDLRGKEIIYKLRF